MLRNIKAIEVIEEPKGLERGRIFRWQLQSFANLIIEMSDYKSRLVMVE